MALNLFVWSRLAPRLPKSGVVVAVAVAVAVAEILICFAALPVQWRPGGRRTGRAPFFDKTGTSYRKIPAPASHSWPVPLQGEPFSLVTFLLGQQKKVTRPRSGRKLCTCLWLSYKQDQTIKASATKAAGNFLLSKATKESHQRKMLLL
ncbi:hypothetical protein [Lysobacter sp. Hz 25]|uniref:hypothetical protein n=1 Tax=Lysobacter sp. Hz 25 TaxID=3383698 RepID=UPI0038D40684